MLRRREHLGVASLHSRGVLAFGAAEATAWQDGCVIEHDNSRYYVTDRAVEEYASYDHLMESEAAILELLRSEGLGEMRMLDLGVGGGRTTLHYAPHAGEYHGLDYSAPLVEACRRRFADRAWDHVTWIIGDARALAYEDDFFDFVMFSWNGLDAVGDEPDRMRALHEIRRVLRPGGRFLFSAHNLEYAVGRQSLPRWILRRLLNPRLRAIASRPAARIVDERVGITFESHYYIRPAAQLEQLRSAGFSDAVALRPDGAPVPDPAPGEFETRHWLYYLCRA